MAMSMAMNSQCFVIMRCIGDHSFHQHRCCHKYWYGQSDVWPEPVRRKWIERCPGLQHYGTDELRVFPSRALISFRMFGVDFLGLHAGEILKQVSVCQIDDFLEFMSLDSQMYAQSSQRLSCFDASGRRDASRRVVDFFG